MTIFQIQLSLPSTLETENTEETTSKTNNSIHSANTHSFIFIIKTVIRSKNNLLFSNF